MAEKMPERKRSGQAMRHAELDIFLQGKEVGKRTNKKYQMTEITWKCN